MAARSLAVAVAFALPRVLAAQNVAEVQVAPPSVTIRVGERTGVLATAFDRIGNVIPTVRFSWSSNNVNVAKVDNSGTITGVGGGVTIIEARAGSRRGQAAVQVMGPPAPAPGSDPGQGSPPAPPPASGPSDSADPLAGQPAGTGTAVALRIEPSTILLLPSENTRIAPRALKEDGSPAAPVRVTWRSLRADVASVDQAGNIVALSPGQGVIQAIGPGGLTATAPVVVQQTEIAIREPTPYVLSPNQIDTLRVVVPQQNGREVNALQLQWASSDPAVARVSLIGIVTAATPGRATIAVRGLLQQATIEVVVHRPVEGLVVRPPRSSDVVVPLSGRQKFEAQALASDNSVVREAPLAWMVTDTTIATFDPVTSLLTGKAVGKTQLTVRGPGSGLSVAWTVSVITGNVKLSARRIGIAINERHTLRGNYIGNDGAVLAPAVNVTWSSDRPEIATVSEDGMIAGVGYGRARIAATAPGGSSDTTEVFVQGEILVSSTRGGGGAGGGGGGGGARSRLYAIERSNLALLRPVTTDTATATEPAYSPDGSRIAYVSTKDGNPEIYVMDSDGRNPVRLTNERQADEKPTFTPDGQTVLFQSTRTKNTQIWSVGVDGSSLRPLTVEGMGTNLQPAVSPDGGTVAFTSIRLDGTPDIWLMAKDGTQQRPFTKTPQSNETYPRFLRDGSLAYLVERREGNRTVSQVVKADLATGLVTPLSGTDLFVTSFSVSPAGDLLALVVPMPGTERRRNPVNRVYIQPVGAGAPVPIPATGEEQIATPTFQP